MRENLILTASEQRRMEKKPKLAKETSKETSLEVVAAPRST